MNVDDESALALRPESDQRGFSVLEAVVGVAISVFAIIGLAHSFGLGRGMVDEYEIARSALGVAQRRMESMTTRPPASLIAGTDSSLVFLFRGKPVGSERWIVEWADERIDSLGAADPDGPNDLKRVVVTVRWGSGVRADTIRFARLFPPA